MHVQYMATCKNFEKNQDIYMNFEKIQQKQSFYNQLTKVNCMKSNNIKKINK